MDKFVLTISKGDSKISVMGHLLKLKKGQDLILEAGTTGRVFIVLEDLDQPHTSPPFQPDFDFIESVLND